MANILWPPTPENVECPTCQGVGSSWEDHVGNCPDCNGTGRAQTWKAHSQSTPENVESPTTKKGNNG